MPFVAHYRKDYWSCPQLSASDLWLIYEWDEKFIHILTKKANLRAMYMAIGTLLSLLSTCCLHLVITNA